MDLESLSRDDDLLCDLLVDNLFFFRTVKMANDYRSSRAKTDKILEIVRRHIIRKGRVSDAVEELLQVDQVKLYLLKKTPKQASDFTLHARRYLQLYLPQAGYELSSTERYTGTLLGSNTAPVPSTENNEACVVAIRDFQQGETLKYCTGSIATLSHDQEAALRSSNKDFSVIWSGRKGRMCLFLGPARFVNHDCDSNCEFISLGVNGISFRAVKPIKIGQEVTSFYGENYFGEGNKECMCATCETRQKGAFADPNRQPSEQSSVNSMNGDEDEENPLGLPRRRQSRRTPRLSDKAKIAEAQKNLKASRGMKRKRSRKGSASLDEIMSDGSLSDAPSDYETMSFLQSATSRPVSIKDRLSDSTHSSESVKREILSDKADDEAISAGSLTPSSLHAAAAHSTPPPKEMPGHPLLNAATVGGSPISLGPNRPPPAHRKTATCTVCTNNFAPPEEWWTPTMCGRCERHMKIYDTKWPERRKEGDADFVDSDEEEKIPTWTLKRTDKKIRKGMSPKARSPKPMSPLEKTHHTHKRSASSSSHKREDSKLQRRGSAPTIPDLRGEQRTEIDPHSEPRPPTMSVYESFNAITAAASGGSPTAGRSLRSRGDQLGATTPTMPTIPTVAVPDVDIKPDVTGDGVKVDNKQKAKLEKRREAKTETQAEQNASIQAKTQESIPTNGKSHDTQGDKEATNGDVKDSAEMDARATRKLRAKKKLDQDLTPTPGAPLRKNKASQQVVPRSSPKVYVDVPVMQPDVNITRPEVKAPASLQRTWGDEDHKSLPSIHEATGGVLNMIKRQQERVCGNRDEGVGSLSLLPLPEIGRIRYDRSVLDPFVRALPSTPDVMNNVIDAHQSHHAVPVAVTVPMPMTMPQTQKQIHMQTQSHPETSSPIAPTAAPLSFRPAEDSAAAEILLALSHGMQ